MPGKSLKVLVGGLAAFGVVTKALDRAGSVPFEPRCAPRLDVLMQRLTAERVDVVLMDCSVAGAGAVTQIHQRYPGLPIIMLADPGQEGLAREALTTGAHDYLVAPDITPVLLDRVIRYAIERQRLLHELERRQVNNDPLTGLPNRHLFLDRLRQARAHAKRNKQLAAVAFVDLDGFKIVNDTFGHAAGDQILKSVAQRLNRSVRESDTVARMGGDEFTLVLSELEAPEGAAVVAQKVLRTLAQPHRLNGRLFIITASIGISVYPNDGNDQETLIDKADLAMYHAKAAGKNQYRFAETPPQRPTPKPGGHTTWLPELEGRGPPLNQPLP
jgi:diguanylate cyclase (GGDEF)-like protein